MKIFITNWNRLPLLTKVIDNIYERTTSLFELHVYDNGSDINVQSYLIEQLRTNRIKSVHLDNRNTGCLYNKAIFNSMVEHNEKYYIVTDNDIIPPKLKPDWLSRMVNIMENNPDIGLLTPQLPPTALQMPYAVRDDIILCQAVGNTFKMVRKEAYPDIQQKLGAYGDDGLVSSAITDKGWKIAFAKDIFCYNLERDYPNWGYTEEQVRQDPRKQGYGPPFRYDPVNWDTLRPPQELII